MVGLVRSNLQAKDVGRRGEQWWTFSVHTINIHTRIPKEILAFSLILDLVGKASPFSHGSETVPFAMVVSMSTITHSFGSSSPKAPSASHARC